MAEPIFDKRDQLEQVEKGLLQGEDVLAVYDCTGTGTGFLGLTTHRIVFQDKSFVGKEAALTSVPYRQVRSVSVVSDKSWAGGFFSSSSIVIDVGGALHQADFRSDDKALHAHNVVLWYITR